MSSPVATPLHIQQIMQFNSEHRIGEDTPLAPGYKDGGRGARYDEDDGRTRIASNRETITFKDPSEDPSLKRVIDKAKAEMSGMTSVAQKAEYLNKLVDRLLHQNDPDLNTNIINNMPPGPDGKIRPSLGDLIDHQTGVCRHRTILFKVLADNTGIPCAMVRGNFRDGNYGGGHAWNEVIQEDGKRLLVDVMHGKVVDMSDPYARFYQDMKNRPMYDNNGPINHGQPQASSKPAISTPAVDIVKLTEAQMTIASTPIKPTEKGKYIGIGKAQAEIDVIKAALIAQGLKPGEHFNERPSSLNAGNNVIQLTPEGAQHVDRIKADFQAGKPPVMVGAGQPAAGVTPEPARPAPTQPQEVDIARLTIAQKVIGKELVVHTEKGNYLGVGKTQDDINTLKAALIAQGLEPDKHFKEKPSSINGGNNVIQLTPEGAQHVDRIKADFQAGKPPFMVGETPEAGKPAASSAEPVKPVQAQAVRPVPVDLALDFGESAKPPAAAQLARPAVATTVDIPLDVTPAQQAGRPSRASVAVDFDISGETPSRTSSSPPRVSSSFVGTGQKVEGRLGVAQTALTAGAQAAQGDYSGAAVTVGSAAAQQAGLGKATQLAEKAAEKAVPVVMAVAEKLGVAGAAKTGGKFVPGLGGVIGAVETAVNVTSALRQGQYGKAGIEAVTGIAATFAGTLGFGAADHTRKIANMIVTATLGEKHAPHQGGLYDVIDTGKATIAAINKPSTNDPAKMSRSELAAAIQRDPDLPDTVPFKGGRADLATALQDKGFRERYLRQLEDENKMGVKRNQEIALIKAYEKSLESPSAPAAQATISQNANRPAPPAASAPSAQAQAQVATLNAQYRSMSTTQLATSILRDPVLPDTVQLNGKNVSITEAIKDGAFRDKLIDNLEKLQAKGQDYTTQIAMLKAYDGKMDASNPVNPVTQMAQSQMQRPVSTPPPSITAPMA